MIVLEYGKYAGACATKGIALHLIWAGSGEGREVTETSDSPFAPVSKPIIFSISAYFRDLQDVHTFAPLEKRFKVINNFANVGVLFMKIHLRI